jgi:hypothetical protein
MIVSGREDLRIWQTGPARLGKERELSSSTLIRRRRLFNIAHFLGVFYGHSGREPPTLIVPSLLITHVLAFRILAKHQRQVWVGQWSAQVDGLAG